MIAAEMKNDVSTVRIHDEFCVNEQHTTLEQMNRILAGVHKRRMLNEARVNHFQPGSIDILP